MMYVLVDEVINKGITERFETTFENLEEARKAARWQVRKNEEEPKSKYRIFNVFIAEFESYNEGNYNTIEF